MDDFRALLRTYRLRLTNLSARNRSLRLQRLSPRQDIDLFEIAFLEGENPTTYLERLIKGKSIKLMSQKSLADPQAAKLDRRLTQIYRELRQRFDETGAYDFCMGYPFVQGKFSEGSVARCPVLLFPVRLVRQRQGNIRWTLEPRDEADALLNPTFFRAYEKFNDVRLPPSFWEQVPDRGENLQALLLKLYEYLRSHGLAIHFNSELFLQRIQPCQHYNVHEIDAFPTGELRFMPNAVAGIFPQSDSALLQDYNYLDEQPEAFPLAEIFGGKNIESALPHTVVEADRHYVLHVDGSQEQVLLELQAGKDVVVDGPPGTGKSQLIVNAVADAMAKGQCVLVVSQKRAALDVVYKRLTGLSLNKWAYLIHDYQDDRKSVFAQLRHQLEDLPAYQPNETQAREWTERYAFLCSQIDGQVGQLARYSHRLAAPLACGLSPYQLYERISQDVPVVPLDDLPGRITAAQLERFLPQASAIASYREFLEPKHPWYHRHPTDQFSAADTRVFLEKLNTLPRILEAQQQRYHGNLLQGKSLVIDERTPAMLVQFDELAQTLDANAVLRDDVAVLLTLEQRHLHHELDALEAAIERALGLEWLSVAMPDEQAQVEQLLAQYQKTATVGYKWLLPKFWRLRGALKDWLKSKAAPLNAASLQRIAQELAQLQAVQQLVARLGKSPFFKGLPRLAEGTWEAYIAQKRANLAFGEHFLAFELLSLKPLPTQGEQWNQAAWQTTLHRLDQLRQDRANWHASWAELATWLPLQKVETLQELALTKQRSPEVIATWARSFEQNAEPLHQLDKLLYALQPIERELLTAIEPLLRNPPPDWQTIVRNSLYHAWLEAAEQQYPVLKAPLSRTFEPEQAALAAQLDEKRDLTIKLLQAALFSKASAFTRSPEYKKQSSELLYQVSKKRQLWPLRRLIATYWEQGMARLMPCVLASPETVAALFPMAAGLFDRVIIDEASQLRIEAALPVLLRGRQRVVSGDDKQLPPFDLFSVRVDEANEDGGAASEADSILALARQHFSPGGLRWHYRSSQPALIAFSNQAFYRSKLLYYPPATPPASPVFQYHKVYGRWEGQTNIIEASQIVDLIMGYLAMPDPPTLGVVTFNFLQQEAVLDALDKRLELFESQGLNREALQLRAAFDRKRDGEPEGLFVKNLENVQGDERDVILFSVGYAPNDDGKLAVNFGLLNQLGGENRLNVAITRARQQVVVVASFLPQQLEVDTTKHEGPKLLKAYLQYVYEQANGPSVPKQSAAVEEHRWVAELHKLLVQKGYRVQADMGMGGVPIALAVTNPSALWSRPVAVLLEEADSQAALDPRDSFVYRRKLLERAGWQVYTLRASAASRNLPAAADSISKMLD